MASSQWRQISAIVDWVVLLQPASVLDIGTGFGKYGLLCREYLDVFEGRLRPGEWRTRIDGIEFFQDCLTPVHQHVYDHVHAGDAVAVLKTLQTGTYDLALVIDVIEHLDQEAGEELLRECRRVSSYTLVSTPKRFFEQGESYGNPRQVHRSEWSPPVLQRHGGLIVHEDEMSSIAIFEGANASTPIKRYAVLRRRRRLAARFQSGHRLYQRIKPLFTRRRTR